MEIETPTNTTPLTTSPDSMIQSSQIHRNLLKYTTLFVVVCLVSATLGISTNMGKPQTEIIGPYLNKEHMFTNTNRNCTSIEDFHISNGINLILCSYPRDKTIYIKLTQEGSNTDGIMLNHQQYKNLKKLISPLDRTIELYGHNVTITKTQTSNSTTGLQLP